MKIFPPLTSVLHLFFELRKAGTISKEEHAALKESLIDACVQPLSAHRSTPACSVATASDTDSLRVVYGDVDEDRDELSVESGGLPSRWHRPTSSSRIQRKQHYEN